MRKMPGENPTYYCHSWESAYALAEQYIRESLSAFKFATFKIYIPILRTPQGIAIPASPYLFAIAFDTALARVVLASSTSYTTTGSNRALAVYNVAQPSGNTMSVTYNSVSMAQIDTVVGDGISSSEDLFDYLLNNPASGSHTIAVTSSSGTITIMAASYTGVKQTNTPDNHGKNNGFGTAATVALTPVASNCWMIGYGRTNGSFSSAGSGTTDRCSPVGGSDAIDSNATVSGSTTLTMNLSSAAWYMLAMTIAPPAAAATQSEFLPFF